MFFRQLQLQLLPQTVVIMFVGVHSAAALRKGAPTLLDLFDCLIEGHSHRLSTKKVVVKLVAEFLSRRLLDSELLVDTNESLDTRNALESLTDLLRVAGI